MCTNIIPVVSNLQKEKGIWKFLDFFFFLHKKKLHAGKNKGIQFEVQ